MLNFDFQQSAWKQNEPCLKKRKDKLSIPTVFNINDKKKNSWAANQHITMISEGSCDAENSSSYEPKLLNGEVHFFSTKYSIQKNLSSTGRNKPVRWTGYSIVKSLSFTALMYMCQN